MATVSDSALVRGTEAETEPERREVDVIMTGVRTSALPDCNEECRRLVEEMDSITYDRYFRGANQVSPERDMTEKVSGFLLNLAKQGPCREFLEQVSAVEPELFISSSQYPQKGADEILKMEKRAQAAYRTYKDCFPTAIWHCCKRLCFTSLSIDPDKILLLESLLQIHKMAEILHESIKDASQAVQNRRRGVGGSDIAFSAPTRGERETIPGTDRQIALRNFARFVLEVLPFLYGKAEAPDGTQCPPHKFFTQAICSLLGVSRNFLYARKRCSASANLSEDEVTSIVDTAGVRLRQLRRNADREGFPSISELQSFECGCSDPCFAEVPIMRLESEYKEFSKLSTQLKPRCKENRYLLNVLFSPLTNSTVKTCNRALAALYTVSEGFVSDVRMVLDAMCSDPSLDDRPFIAEGVEGYRKHKGHPMNRYPDSIREKVEKHLDMVLRADPAGSSGLNVYRVYSPEINTQQKLRTIIATALGSDDSVDEHISASTLQRMIEGYLRNRNCRIVFSQSDHNACPNCKTLKYAVLQFHHEAKELQLAFAERFSRLPRPFTSGIQCKVNELALNIDTKKYQEKETLRVLKDHCERDAAIRKTIKKWSDHFRNVEKEYSKLGIVDGQWNTFSDRASITHQDDMTKVDLPHFVITTSGDITRWRFDVNAHVSSITDDCIVFSHEQGTGPKNSSSILEEILMDHLLRCKGEAVKILVSDNASVGKNWLSTIALPQYLVDQGLADVVIVVFLENNHGKFLADMLFGQLQTRRKRTTLLSVDDLLREFEFVNRKSGKIRGFALNPLSSVDFASVFASLGYKTKPPKDLGFTRRNIHFAAACRGGSKDRLSAQEGQIRQFGYQKIAIFAVV